LNQEHIILVQERKSKFLAHWRSIFFQSYFSNLRNWDCIKLEPNLLHLQVFGGFHLSHILSRSEELLQQGSELWIGLSQFSYEFLFLFFWFHSCKCNAKCNGRNISQRFLIRLAERKKYPILVFKYRERVV
jgi:hypothetical protein